MYWYCTFHIKGILYSHLPATFPLHAVVTTYAAQGEAVFISSERTDSILCCGCLEFYILLNVRVTAVQQRTNSLLCRKLKNAKYMLASSLLHPCNSNITKSYNVLGGNTGHIIVACQWKLKVVVNGLFCFFKLEFCSFEPLKVINWLILEKSCCFF